MARKITPQEPCMFCKEAPCVCSRYGCQVCGKKPCVHGVGFDPARKGDELSEPPERAEADTD